MINVTMKTARGIDHRPGIKPVVSHWHLFSESRKRVVFCKNMDLLQIEREKIFHEL